MAGSQAHVTAEDVQRAQDLLQAWLAVALDRARSARRASDVKLLTTPTILELRGMLSALLADVRDAAYLEGTVAGRRLVADLVQDALRTEGLV